MFLALGLTNARRNLSRSVLAVLAAAVAAIIASSSISLSRGYPAGAAIEARAFLGGDVMVYATGHLVRPGALLSSGDEVPRDFEFATLDPDQVCDLESLHPELYSSGFLAPAGRGVEPIDVAELERRLAQNPHVVQVIPSYFLPARLTYDQITEDGPRTVSLPDMVLRGRDFEAQRGPGRWPFESLLGQASRCPAAGEAYARVCLVDARLNLIGYEPVAPGELVRLYVPAVTVDERGLWHFDYSRETVFELEVVGQYATHTASVSWTTPDGAGQAEELYWITPQLQVPLGAFLDIFAAVSGGGAPRHALQVGLAVRPFSEVENIAAEVRGMLPQSSVISVPRQMALAQAHGLPEAVFRAPLEIVGRPTVQQTGMPVDLSRAFVGLSWLIAGLLLASNMLFLVAQRRREIGVLKALGARGSDVGFMVLAEALTLNLCGTVLGFLLVRLAATWTLISNRIAWAEIGRSTLTDLVTVVSAGAVAATAFALLPAWQMARLSSMEVLRNE